jgi:hypothetical protein
MIDVEIVESTALGGYFLPTGFCLKFFHKAVWFFELATTKKNANDIPYPGNEVSSAARTGVTLYLSALGNGSF